ncbi:unnamed protein product [Diatraea saccharalis]|uniref:C2H2-type domain-containing protein n=1 Tax=Diatraea saccharalis TaxID=40085 RepID=A0A9P0C2L9_9NEOP|nr:unnamed protein product [Diatraea saccharalis]
MEEDIDIEEHDVLNHPAIKSIFPDLSVIKKEISVYEEQALTLKTEPEASSQVSILENTGNDNRVCLKNNYKKSEDDVKFIEEIRPPTNMSLENAKQIFRNKIILGSKPSLPQNCEDHYNGTLTNYEKNIKPFLAKVYLRDMGSYLYNSGRFCQMCGIFFPQKINLENHSKCFHEAKCNSTVEHGRGKMSKCELCSKVFSTSGNLSKHLRNIHKQKNPKRQQFTNERYINPSKRLSNISKFIASKSKSLPQSRCFHCKKLFPSQKCLIEHIYKVLNSSNLTQKTKVKLMKNKKNIRETYITNKQRQSYLLRKKYNKEKSKNIENKKTHENSSLYKCYYCSYYFNERKFYIKHLAKKHKDNDVIITNKVIFDPHCKFCPANVMLLNVYSYNIHLLSSHKDMVNETFRIEPKLHLTKVELILAGKQSDPENVEDCSKRANNNQTEENVSYSSMNQDIETRKDVSFLDMGEKEQLLGKSNVITKSYDSSKQSNVITELYESCKKLDFDNGMDEDTEENNEFDYEQNEPLVLKGILFKCKRCDINFLTNRCAMSHSEHMEYLINWKCHICLKIFKKNDEILHIQQHSFSNEFVVYELSESKLSRVLYKCPKCAIHFDDYKYGFHFKLCGKIVAESSYCNACDILLEKSVVQGHEYEHKTNNQSLSDFTIITSDVINNFSEADVKILKKEINPFKKELKSLNNNNKDKFKMSYCYTCKTFISLIYMRNVHKEGNCAHMIKHVCKYCGLILTNQSLKTHRNKHKLDKNLKLQDFKFYNIKTNKRMLPPIPDYPKCKSCDVRFLTKTAVTNHVCENIDFLTCPTCNIKLCDEAFKLHVSFHHYYIKRPDDRVCNRNITDKPESIESECSTSCNDLSTVIENISKNNMDFAVRSEQNEKETISNSQFHELERSSPEVKLNKYNSGSVKSVVKLTSSEMDTGKSVSEPLAEGESTIELFGVFFCCLYCYVTLTTYDQVVQHCQDHYGEVDITKKIKTCSECKMKYDQSFAVDHSKLHDLRASGKDLKVLNFDAVYFAVDYKLWIKLMFDSLEPEETHYILNRSIYKYEGRMKLQVFQKGTSELTVYKCNTCRMFVQPKYIFSHAEDSCFRLRKHMCSFCGLPFVSHLFRIDHEKIHRRTPGLSANSFNIVVFNRTKDKEYINNIISSRDNFIFYQCRKCMGLIERFQCRDHDCNKNNLKKCTICKFLINNCDYKSHILKHTLIKNFIQKNMKIIRFGKYDNELDDVFNGLPSEFSGTLKDYNFYKCTRCDLYLRKSTTEPMKHDCSDTNSKIECTKCNLSFLKKEINRHYKIHDSDPYFVKENFNVLLYNESTVDWTKIELSRVNKNLSDMTSEPKIIAKKENITNNDENSLVRIAKIYKCDCGQHFLDRISIQSHFRYCKTKIIKQTCTKCSLSFSPKDLFSHLLRHHGDKRYTYKFTIIPMTMLKNKVIDLYNCSNCNLHFAESDNALEHFSNCLHSMNEGSECSKCKLFFDNSCFDFHVNHHHDDDVADFDVVDIIGINNIAKNNTDENEEIPNLTSQAHSIIDANYKISEESLSQVSLNSYSNTIYKCVDCNIHFLTEHTFKKHKERHEPVSFIQKNCELCGLNFSLPSLTKHIYVHHSQMKLESSNINIKCTLK